MPIGLSETYYRKILSNDAFVASEQYTIASGSSDNLHIENPAGGEKIIIVIGMVVSSTGEFLATMHDEFSSAPSGGTSAEVQAVLLDSDGTDDDGVAEVNTSVSYANGAATYGTVGGGTGGNTVGGTHDLPSVAIEPGREIVVDAENIASSENDFTITVTYFEKDV